GHNDGRKARQRLGKEGIQSDGIACVEQNAVGAVSMLLEEPQSFEGRRYVGRKFEVKDAQGTGADASDGDTRIARTRRSEDYKHAPPRMVASTDEPLLSRGLPPSMKLDF